MSEQTNIEVLDASVGGDAWLGASGGRSALERLRAKLEGTDAGFGVLALDFSGVTLLTASAVRTGVLPLQDAQLSNGKCLVLTNVNDAGLDEVQLAAEASKTALPCARLQDGRLDQCVVLGSLDPKLKETLLHVLALEVADAKAVKERSGEPAVVTVWNNRLVALHQMGLLTERRVGRTKFYEPIVKGMRYGR